MKSMNQYFLGLVPFNCNQRMTWEITSKFLMSSTLSVSQCLFTSCWTLLKTRGRSWRWGIKTSLVCWSKFLNGMTRSCWSWWFHSSKNCPSSWRTRMTWWVEEMYLRIHPVTSNSVCVSHESTNKMTDLSNHNPSNRVCFLLLSTL